MKRTKNNFAFWKIYVSSVFVLSALQRRTDIAEKVVPQNAIIHMMGDIHFGSLTLQCFVFSLSKDGELAV